jgi:hypothetical protein
VGRLSPLSPKMCQGQHHPWDHWEFGMPGGGIRDQEGAIICLVSPLLLGTKHSALNGAGRVDRLRASGATGELGCLGPSSPTDCVSRRRLPATCPQGQPAAPRTPQEAHHNSGLCSTAAPGSGDDWRGPRRLDPTVLPPGKPPNPIRASALHKSPPPPMPAHR